MRNYGFVHNDIKPENLTLILEDFENTEKKSLRFIDLGLANDTLQCSGFTVRYFMSPMRKYLNKDGIVTPIFSDFDEKYRNEMFSVFRTIQDLMITDSTDPRIEKHFLLPGINNNA
jgi:serine/threonine protein kinase